MQVLPSPALVPTSQEGGNVTDTNKYAMSLPGSLPITPLPPGFSEDNTQLPMPKIPADQMPVSNQPGHHGGVGLPPSRPNQTAPLREQQIDGVPQGIGEAGGKSQPRSDGFFIAGPAVSGPQGEGNTKEGAGDSGPASLFKATPGFRDPAWAHPDTNQ